MLHRRSFRLTCSKGGLSRSVQFGGQTHTTPFGRGRLLLTVEGGLMTFHDLAAAVQAGRRPSCPYDYGPHTDKIQALLDVIRSNKLLRFGGILDDRFIPVRNLEEAAQLAYGPNELDFRW